MLFFVPAFSRFCCEFIEEARVRVLVICCSLANGHNSAGLDQFQVVITIHSYTI